MMPTSGVGVTFGILLLDFELWTMSCCHIVRLELLSSQINYLGYLIARPWFDSFCCMCVETCTAVTLIDLDRSLKV